MGIYDEPASTSFTCQSVVMLHVGYSVDTTVGVTATRARDPYQESPPQLPLL